MEEGATLKPQHEEKMVGCSFSESHFAGQKDVKREEKHNEGNFPQ